MAEGRRPPEWLIGLLIATVLAVLAFLYADELGIGDEPGLTEPGGAVEVRLV
jgi:hypothetical protein